MATASRRRQGVNHGVRKWGPRYGHAPILRWRDGNTDGDLSDEGDSTLYYGADANFNVTALVDTSGAAVERYLYEPYGKVTVLDPDWSADEDGQSDFANELLFTGHRLDGESGLYYAIHRHYHPTLGRWISRDPKGYVDGMGLYEYVRSRPATTSDALGLREGPATNFGHDFDLFVVVATDAPMGFRGDIRATAGIWANETGGGTSAGDLYKDVKTSKEFVEVIKARYEQVNRHAKTDRDKRGLRVIVIGHGTGVTGPYVGRGMTATPQEKQAGALLYYPPDPDPGRMLNLTESQKADARDKAIREKVDKTPMGQVKGMIGDATFTNCNIADGEGAAVLDTSARELGMDITAPKRVGETKTEDNGDITFTPTLKPDDKSDKPADYIHSSKGRQRESK